MNPGWMSPAWGPTLCVGPVLGIALYTLCTSNTQCQNNDGCWCHTRFWDFWSNWIYWHPLHPSDRITCLAPWHQWHSNGAAKRRHFKRKMHQMWSYIRYQHWLVLVVVVVGDATPIILFKKEWLGLHSLSNKRDERSLCWPDRGCALGLCFFTHVDFLLHGLLVILSYGDVSHITHWCKCFAMVTTRCFASTETLLCT